MTRKKLEELDLSTLSNYDSNEMDDMTRMFKF